MKARLVPFGRWSVLLLAIAHLPWSPLGVQAQDPVRLELRVEDGGVNVQLGNLLESGGILRSLESGLPIRIRVVTELWRDRFLDSQDGRHEWRATVRYDPLSDRFRIELAEDVAFNAESTLEATEILNDALEVPLRPTSQGRYYYLGRLEVETLSLSDLEELRGWLQGDLGPAIEGDREVGGAIGRGLRRLFIRSLALPAERFQTRTPRFDWGG